MGSSSRWFLACFGLPTLLVLRGVPQVVFWLEFACAAMLVAAWVLRPTTERCGCDSRFVAVTAMLLAVGLAVSLAAGGLPSAGAGFCAYVSLFVAAVCLAGADVRVGADRHAIPYVIAAGVLMVAIMQSVAGLVQLLGFQADGLVLPMAYLQTYGNIGQPNHYAAFLTLGLAAVVLGPENPVWPRWLTVAVMLWIAVSIAASASRAPLLYMLAFLVLGLVARRHGTMGAKAAGGRAVLVAAMTLAVQIGSSYSGILAKLGVTSAMARRADAGSNGQRLYDWSLALSAIKAHPWAGVGIGGFHGWAIEQMPSTQLVPFSKFAEHAHNLPLHLAATMGVPFTLLSLGALVWWLVRQLRVPMTPERLFALCGLSVIGLHSMVEYPLWYAYFIIPAGLFCGILTATDPRVRTVEVPAWGIKALGALFVLSLVWVGRDYVVVERAYSDWSSLRERTPDAERERIRASLGGVPNWSIVADHARSLELQLWRPERVSAAGVAQQCEPAFKARPSWGLGTQCLLAMGMAGDRAGVARMSLVLCEGFPRHHQMLREWAEGVDRFHPAVSVQSENCLRKS